MSTLRIALFTYSTKPRGSVVHTLELARGLRQLGHHPTIFALDKDGQGFASAPGVDTRLVPAQPCDGDIDRLIRQRIQELVDYLQSHWQEFDIFHAQDCIGANALTTLKQQGKSLTLVRTIHHVEDFESPYLQACQDKSIRLPDCCLCVSRVWEEYLQTHYGIRATRVFNGVDAQRYTPDHSGTELRLAQALGINGSPIFLTVGGIEPRKNTLRLVQAFAQVRQSYPTAQLVIAGGATLFDYQDYRQQCFAWMDRLNLQVGRDICLPGVVADQDLPGLYRLADGFVFPSVQEGWGLVVLEALATGVPVVTSDKPPFTEFLTPEQALLVVPTSVDAIAHGMLQVIQPQVGSALVDASRSVVSAYTWSASAQCHGVIYQQLLEGNHAGNSLSN